MHQYHDLLETILSKGTQKTDRTGTGTLSVFGPQLRFDLSEGFPLLTTKKLHVKSIVHELLWILSGNTNIKYLNDHGVRIWDEWADKDGNLGPIYGAQWRSCDGVDQIQEMITLLKNTPDSRRMVVDSWNVAELPQMALSPCHCLFQFYTEPLTELERQNLFFAHYPSWTLTEGGTDLHNIPKFRLSCQLYQRSADVFLGVPFNIASYALLTHMMAQVVNMVPGEFIWTGGDTHLYLNHLKQAREQLQRVAYPLPTVRLNPEITDLFAFKYEDISFDNYQAHPAIKAQVSV